MIPIADHTLQSFAALAVLDEHGLAVQLSSLWEEQVAVLVFVRHFG